MPTTIFLSYARHDDEPFVQRLHGDLKKAGFGVWFDRDSVALHQGAFDQQIADAIRAFEQVVLVIGPHAASSDSVHQQWRWALELDKRVTPILRLGEYEHVPAELGLLHCEDFRDDAKYDTALAKLIRSLSQPNPKLGELCAVPSLPPHFLGRPNLLSRVRDALLVDLKTAQVITGADARVGLQGMAGIGKSVLAAALARDRQVREAFPDGVVWIGCGHQLTQDDLLSRLRDVVRHLGGEAAFDSLPQGQVVLRALLQAKAVLLVLDDVCRASDVQAFDKLGPCCRMLVTTRDAGILHTLHCDSVPVSLFTEAEALQLLADVVGVAPDALPAEAREVADECGLLPLALTLSGGMAKKRDGDFHAVLERLRRADFEKIADRESINEQHSSIGRAIQASVDILPQAEQERFAELAVFPADSMVPDASVMSLWCRSGTMSEDEAKSLLLALGNRSLVQLSHPAFETDVSRWHVSLHDLVHDFATRLAQAFPDGLAPLHMHMARFYHALGLPRLHDNITALKYLPYHACEGNATDIWLTTMTDFGYFQAVVDRVDVTEGEDGGIKIPWHAGYFIVLDEIERWLGRKPTQEEAEELIKPLHIVWQKRTEFLQSADGIMPKLYGDLKTLEKTPPKKVIDRIKRQIVVQHGPLWTWCERERQKYEDARRPWSVFVARPTIFISYRREGGEHLAGRVKDALKDRGFSVFMDVEDLKSGKFDETLLEIIEEAIDVIVILTPGCLDRCKNDDDWLRREIRHAITCKRNIVPIIARGFQMPRSEDLPPDIAELPRFNGPTSTNEFFEASISRLVSTFLKSGKTE